MTTTTYPLRRRARKESICACGRLILVRDWIYKISGRWVCGLCALARMRAAR
jgi:hypothetical protein